MAVTKSGKVVGVSLNGSHEPGHLDEMQSNADNCSNQRFRKILQLLVAVERGAEVFNKYPDIDRLIEVRILSVDTSMRGRGIAKALLEKTRELATQLGFPLMRVDCTSHFSAKAMARLGFECIFTLRYEDYCQNGKPVFHPEKPHTEVTSYVQRLAH
ncbi:Dopamine N-acetyltransferase [Blattella germanica]|nr:Dopamine N-acetyltransferase [Blattella germanica]